MSTRPLGQFVTRARLLRVASACAVILICLAELAASSIPSLVFFEDDLLDTAVRKVGHVGTFFVISFGALHVLGGLLGRRLATLLVVAGATAIAVTDEVIQLGIAGRLASPLDVFLDLAGILGGVIAYRRFAGPKGEVAAPDSHHHSDRSPRR